MVLDAEFRERMHQIFLDDLGRALEIDLEAFRRRPKLVHVAEWAANPVAPVL